MKYSVLLISVLSVFMSCNNAADNGAANVAIVEKYIQAVETEDYEVMASLLDEDYLGMGPSFGDSIGRDDALASWKENVANLYDKIENGKIIASLTFYNEADALRQLGYVFINPNEL